MGSRYASILSASTTSSRICAAPARRAGRQGAGRGACSLCQRLGRGMAGDVGTEVLCASVPVGRFRRARGKGTPTMSPAQRMSEGHYRPRSRRSRGGGLTGGQDGLSEKSGEQGLPRRLVVHRMGMRHGRLGEFPCQAHQEARRGVRGVPWRGGEVDVLQYRRDAPLRECDLFEVRVAASVTDPPHGVSSSPRFCLMRQPCYDGRERLIAMRREVSPGKCREFGAGVGDPRIVTFGARAPCVRPALGGGRIGRRGRIVARMLRSRHATIPKGIGRAGYERQKLGGGARASPPHKTLSGFDIHIHNTRSEPAVNQLGEEFHGRLRGGIGAGDGEHGPDVIGKGAEPCRRLACERGPLGHAPV